MKVNFQCPRCENTYTEMHFGYRCEYCRLSMFPMSSEFCSKCEHELHDNEIHPVLDVV